MKQGNLVWRLLRRNISASQIVGYAVANLVGLTIVLTALQFYRDTTSAKSSDEDSVIGHDYLIISKQVSEAGALLGASNSFSTDEIDEISRQPWVENIGRFTPSRFHVNGSLTFGGRGMSTHLFFEAIPDEFFDVKPAGWGFDPSDRSAIVPIIISKDYLALYNFGFATSQGLPQVSEQLVGTVPLRLRLSGKGDSDTFEGRVVGFSSRLNTIAVPESFMTWANDRFGDEADFDETSRLILRVNDPGSPAMMKYFEDHGIEIAGDHANFGKVNQFLSIMSMVVIAIGVVISLLAFFILMLSIFLLLQKNREKIHDLMMLGYTPRRTASPYYMLVAVVNGLILLLAVVAMLIVKSMWAGPFENLGLQCTGPLPTIIIGIAIMAAITAVNAVAIRRIVRRNF